MMYKVTKLLPESSFGHLPSTLIVGCVLIKLFAVLVARGCPSKLIVGCVLIELFAVLVASGCKDPPGRGGTPGDHLHFLSNAWQIKRSLLQSHYKPT